MSVQDVELMIVGAGLSGIGMAVHVQQRLAGTDYLILERRENIGGTWDLFRYPGIRSDSDMHTLGFVFEPWREADAIADGPAIMRYLAEVRDRHRIGERIRFNRKVMSADWVEAEARWHVRVEGPEGEERWRARFLYMSAGYYDYDQGHDPALEGRETFGGTIVHPQFWPEYLDYAGKKVVVIGSGATAVTLVPAMAGRAAHVTMLQRTPTWYFARPRADVLANFLRRIMPERWAYAATRWKNVRLGRMFFNRARAKPDKVGAFLHKGVKKHLGEAMNMADFTPPYNPWEQRLCLVPDGDLFQAMKAGTASIVTDRIRRIDRTGIELESGRHLDADVIVTATGLELAVAGKVAVSRNGRPVNWHDELFYKGCMISNVPNFFVVFGYLNASWTLKADVVAAFACRVMAAARERNADAVEAPLSAEEADRIADDEVFDFSSGYIQRALHRFPRAGHEMPWHLSQDYLSDRKLLLEGAIEDGVLQLRRAEAPTRSREAA